MFKITVERYYPYCEEAGETQKASIETSNSYPTITEAAALFENLVRSIGLSFSGSLSVKEFEDEKDLELEN